MVDSSRVRGFSIFTRRGMSGGECERDGLYLSHQAAELEGALRQHRGHLGCGTL